MKLTAQLNNENHEISFEREAERLIAEVDGRSYEICAREVDNGLYLLTHNGGVYECLVESDRARRDNFTVHLRNRTYVTTVIDPRRLSSVHGSGSHTGDGSAQITSPMAGKIVRVLVEQGAHVKAGEDVVVVEAMKMQNALKASRDGVVAEIRVVEGGTVDAGEVLATIEAVTD